MDYATYTKLGLTKKDVDSCTKGDLAMVFTAHLFLKGRSELDRLRLKKALIDFLWEKYPHMELYNLIISKLDDFPVNTPSRNTARIIISLVCQSIEELGYEWKIKKVDRRTM